MRDLRHCPELWQPLAIAWTPGKMIIDTNRANLGTLNDRDAGTKPPPPVPPTAAAKWLTMEGRILHQLIAWQSGNPCKLKQCMYINKYAYMYLFYVSHLNKFYYMWYTYTTFRKALNDFQKRLLWKQDYSFWILFHMYTAHIFSSNTHDPVEHGSLQDRICFLWNRVIFHM